MKWLKEEAFVVKMVVMVGIALAIIIPAKRNVQFQLDEAADAGFEAGYTIGFNEAKDITIIKTFEIDGDTHIIIEFSDGEMHEYISPAA